MPFSSSRHSKRASLEKARMSLFLEREAERGFPWIRVSHGFQHTVKRGAFASPAGGNVELSDKH